MAIASEIFKPTRTTNEQLKKLEPLLGYTVCGLTFDSDGDNEECQPVGLLLKDRNESRKTFWLPVMLEGMLIQ